MGQVQSKLVALTKNIFPQSNFASSFSEEA